MSSREAKMLKTYTDWHANGIAVWKILRLYMYSWLLPGVLVVYGSTVLWDKRPLQAGILLGLLIGVVLRDIGNTRKVMIGWPLLDKIIDWNRVQELLGSHAK